MDHISEPTAIKKAAEVVEAARPVSSEDYYVTETYRAAGRWRIRFNVHGDIVTVRLDAKTGNLAAEEGHNKTSENLYR